MGDNIDNGLKWLQDVGILGGYTNMNEKIATVLNEMSAYLSIAQMKKLQEVIVYRKKYPDVSLNDLSIIMTEETGKTITKSGLNHRFRKIQEMAKKLDDK